MTGIKSEITRKTARRAAEQKSREAMKRESRQTESDGRLKHYVGKEKAELKRGAKEAKANRDLRSG